MKPTTLKLAALAFFMACLVPALVGGKASHPQEPVNTGMADPGAFRGLYQKWEAEYIKYGGDENFVLPLAWSRGLSSEGAKAQGYVKINLVKGTISSQVNGLSLAQGWDLWLIENRPGPDHTVLPESGDLMLKVGTLKPAGKISTLQADLGPDAFAQFEPELAIITRAGMRPEDNRVLVGTVTLFHRLYRSGQRGHFGVLDEDPGPAPDVAEKPGFWNRLISALSPTAEAQSIDPIDSLVTRGRTIFFNEKFNGNGRTCGTCHRENNNFTIDPTFISTLPPDDALFVAEFNTNLKENFEKPALMRNVGLILENVDGFEDLAHKFVMRGVPHTLALRTSISSNLPGFVNATGWSGDGAPSGETVALGDGTLLHTTGSLRDFAVGAVRQHFTKRLNRVPGVDFRFPTSAELDALEAFQLSLGRQQDLTLPLNLKGALAKAGQNIFLDDNVGKCNFCHFNAGATDRIIGVNANFNTGVEDLPLQPGKLIDPTIPRDGGFGKTPNPIGGFGDGTFNIAPLVESADTGPFFHNNAVATIEAAVDFYDSEAFNNSPGGQAVGGIRLDRNQVQAIASFLRVINALENIRSAIDLEQRAKLQSTQAGAAALLNLSIAELNNAISDLANASLHPDALVELRSAVSRDQQAINTPDTTTRNQIIDKAIVDKQDARNFMVSP